MYTYKCYKYPSVILHEYYFKGNYGAKGEKRQPRRNFTPEQIKEHNRRHKAKTVQLLILENFKEGDYYTTLTYLRGTRKPISEVNRDFKLFINALRRAYKKRGEELKFIYRLEIGSKGAPHIHIIVNRIQDTDVLIVEKWKYGHSHNMLLNSEDPTFRQLAEYITKPPQEEAIEILKSVGDSEDLTKLVRYSCSRNLKRPTPEVKTYRNRKMNKIFNNDLQPTPGYYIDKDEQTLRRGVNPYTGWSYLTYTEIRLTKGFTADPVKLCECPHCHQFTIDEFGCDCLTRKIRKRRARYG